MRASLAYLPERYMLVSSSQEKLLLSSQSQQSQESFPVSTPIPSPILLESREDSQKEQLEAHPEDVTVPREIKPINVASIHRICSGQVVVDLATAVKELVENSVDAGADNIEVRLRDYGLTCIEVSDNGSGIEECDYAGIGRKHWTSKISQFEDLTAIASFGFRGEALSSLCALCEVVTIATRREGTSMGALLTLNHEGEIVSQVPIARNIGTTVTLYGLFSSLPVRRKAFEKTSKQELTRTITILHSYGIILRNTRLHCVHEITKNQTPSKTIVVKKDQTPLKSMNIKASDAASTMATASVTRTVFCSTRKASRVLDNYISLFGREDGANLECIELDLHQLANSFFSLNMNETVQENNLVLPTLDDLTQNTSTKDISQDLTQDDTQKFIQEHNINVDVSQCLPNSNTSHVSSFDRLDSFRMRTSSIKSPSTSRTSTPHVTPKRRKMTTSIPSFPVDYSHRSSIPATPPVSVKTPTSTPSTSSLIPTTFHNYSMSLLISKLLPQHGRSTTDRQFTYLNGRPVDLPHIQRAINEVYRSFSVDGGNFRAGCGSFPVLILNIQTPPHSFDVNVTPNKREVFIKGEKEILQLLRFYFQSKYERLENVLPAATQQSIQKMLLPMVTPTKSRTKTDTLQQLESETENLNSSNFPHHVDETLSNKRIYNETDASQPAKDKESRITSISELNEAVRNYGSSKQSIEIDQDIPSSNPFTTSSSLLSFSLVANSTASLYWMPTSSSALCFRSSDHRGSDANDERSFSSTSSTSSSLSSSHSSINFYENALMCSILEAMRPNDDIGPRFDTTHASSKDEMGQNGQDMSSCDTNSCEMSNSKKANASQSPISPLHCTSDITIDNDAAETILSRTIQKNDFLSMQVLGQFNLGFLITRLDHTASRSSPVTVTVADTNTDAGHDNNAHSSSLPSVSAFTSSDLFIVDQHACDEKFRFENFWSQTAVHRQHLIVPMSLDISLEHEQIIRDHLDIFQANGFDFSFRDEVDLNLDKDKNENNSSFISSINNTAHAKSQVCVTRLPFSKNVTFSSHDIAQLCELIRDSPYYSLLRNQSSLVSQLSQVSRRGKIPRIPRLNAIFASRACRSAVMIGMALPRLKMNQIVRQMAQLDQPWSCPHGRPTMRHLLDLQQYTFLCTIKAKQEHLKTHKMLEQDENRCDNAFKVLEFYLSSTSEMDIHVLEEMENTLVLSQAQSVDEKVAILQNIISTLSDTIDARTLLAIQSDFEFISTHTRYVPRQIECKQSSYLVNTFDANLYTDTALNKQQLELRKYFSPEIFQRSSHTMYFEKRVRNVLKTLEEAQMDISLS